MSVHFQRSLSAIGSFSSDKENGEQKPIAKATQVIQESGQQIMQHIAAEAPLPAIKEVKEELAAAEEQEEEPLYPKHSEIVQDFYKQTFPDLNVEGIFKNIERKDAYRAGVEAGKTIFKGHRAEKALLQCAEELYYHGADLSFIVGLVEKGCDFKLHHLSQDMKEGVEKEELTSDFAEAFFIRNYHPEIIGLRNLLTTYLST